MIVFNILYSTYAGVPEKADKKLWEWPKGQDLSMGLSYEDFFEIL